MIRARFELIGVTDPRPVIWPIKHPYWCTGYGKDDGAVIVAYADDEDEILRQWPEAGLPLDVEQVESYTFSGRLQRPDWLGEDGRE